MGAPYSMTMSNGSLITTSGHLAIDENGEAIGNDIATQTKVVLDNVIKTIAAEGCKKENIMHVSVFLQDIKVDFDAFNEEYIKFFGDCKPTRATVGAVIYKPQFLIEVLVMADKNCDNRK